MDSNFSTSKSDRTALPGPSVDGNALSSLCGSRQLVLLIDKRRALAAEVAGVDVEIAMALGDRDAASKALKEMEAQVGARRAVRSAGCFFSDQGEADRLEILA